MTYTLFADVMSLILIIVGAFLVFSAAVGVKVTGDPEFGVAERGDLGVLILLVIFAAMTSPVTAQRLGRVSRREGLYGVREDMSRNDAPADRSIRRR